jgi:hypothetical protein
MRAASFADDVFAQASHVADDEQRPPGAWVAAAAYALAVALALHAITFWGRGIIDREAVTFVLNYRADRPLLARIFDPSANDGGYYQARELSYAVDLVDAKLFAALFERHILCFVPASGVIGLVAIAAIFSWAARRVFRLDHLTAALLLALFLSSIVTQASTAILYRSSKILLGVALLGFLCHLSSIVGRNERASRASLAGLFLLGVLMPASDRQGFFYLVVATGTVATLWLAALIDVASPRINYVPVIVTNGCAIAAATFYNDVAGPMLIHWANGYWPDFSYQRLSLRELFAQRAVRARAWQMFRSQTSYFFGNAPFPAIAAATAVACAVSAWRGRTAEVLIVSLLSAASLMGMLAMMILRHPPVYFIADHALRYYTLTIHVAYLFGLTLLLSSLGQPRGNAAAAAVSFLLLSMIAGNVWHYPQQRSVMVDAPGYLKRQYGRSQKFARDFESDERRDPRSRHWPPAWLQP